MSQRPDNILYIPIRINGGTEVPNDLLERELFIKNGELYVGTGNGKKEMIIGKVVDKAVITNPTISQSLYIDNSLVVSKDDFKKNKDSYTKTNDKGGMRVLFIDEGQY